MAQRLFRMSKLMVWAPAIIALLVVFLPTNAHATAEEQGDGVIFSYSPTTIYQEVGIDPSVSNEITATARLAEFGYGVDQAFVGIELYGEGGGGIYFHNTGWTGLSSGGYSNISISVNSESVGSGWADIRSARIVIGGDDGEFWAGNYGPIVESASLKIGNQELLQNPEFAFGQQNWTSSVGWQTCHATQGNKPCSTIQSKVSNGSYSLSENMIWAVADEGWELSASAPGGGKFTQVIFASYGNPSGMDGQYTQGWCHANNSILKVSQAFVGQSSASIGADNGIFGDPCGGTYKRLYIVLKYSGASFSTTTSSTTTTVLVPETTTSVPETTSSAPETTVAIPETTTSIEPETTTSVEPEAPLPTPTLPPESETPQTTILPQEPDTGAQEPEAPTETTQPEEQSENSPVDSTVAPEQEPEAIDPAPVTEDAPVNVENIDEISEEEITPEVAEQLVDVLTSGEATDEQIVEAVDKLLDSEAFTPELATELATSPEVLESITTEQAEAIFSEIDESELTEEQALEIIDAVQDAPEEVRETFEDTVDLFSGTFDTYQMVGQTISVGERRTIVAVNLIAATATATALSGGMPGPSGGGSSGGGGGSPGGSSGGPAARKNEEGNEEQEMAGEIAGDGVDWVSNLSIYKIVNGERVFSVKAFIKKFWLGVLNLGFTIAGSVVVYFTLSGSIQKIALVSTVLAFMSAMYLHMREPE